MRSFKSRGDPPQVFITFIEDGEEGPEVPFDTERLAKVAIWHFLQEYTGFLPPVDDVDDEDDSPTDEQLESIKIT